MLREMKYFLLMVLLALTGASSCAQLQAPVPHDRQLAQRDTPTDLTGIYLCSGTDPTGNKYEGAVEITAYGELWALRWVFKEGDDGHGFGILEGNVLSVIFQTTSIGWGAYRIEADGPARRLRGRWTSPGERTLFTETLTKTTAKSVDDLLLGLRRVGV